MHNKAYLLADIGGTNARFALGDEHGYYRPLVLPVAEFDGPEAAIEAYLQHIGLVSCPPYVCLGIAAPADRDNFAMSNSHWQFAKAAIQKHFAVQQLHFINDFAALALAVPQLGAEQLDLLGAVHGDNLGPKAVLGPGTGFGVAALLNINGDYLSVSSEAGHICFHPENEMENSILEYFYTKYKRVSFERMLCGQGLENIYQAICAMKSRTPVYTSGAEISRSALAGDNNLAMAAVDLYLDMLASFAGDVALMFNAVGGVYIGGGVAIKLRDLIINRDMRQRFDDKGRLKEAILLRTPLYLINAELSALQGTRLALDMLVRQDRRCF